MASFDMGIVSVESSARHRASACCRRLSSSMFYSGSGHTWVAAMSSCLYVQQVDIVIIDDSPLQWPYMVVIVASSLRLADGCHHVVVVDVDHSGTCHRCKVGAEALIFYVVVVCAGGTLL